MGRKVKQRSPSLQQSARNDRRARTCRPHHRPRKLCSIVPLHCVHNSACLFFKLLELATTSAATKKVGHFKSHLEVCLFVVDSKLSTSSLHLHHFVSHSLVVTLRCMDYLTDLVVVKDFCKHNFTSCRNPSFYVKL